MAAFNILIVAQAGRLQYEAALFAASLRARSPGFTGRLIVAVPRAGPLWPKDPGLSDPEVSALLTRLGGEITGFDAHVFGASYPQGNKIEALGALPARAPFVFFDSDTLILDELADIPFDFGRPSASLRVEGTWPQPALYGPGYAEIWRALYERFGLDFESSLDLSQPDEHWRRYLYFNAGVFYGRCPQEFGARFLDYARSIRDDPPEELACQSLDPWLDQIALPLVIHGLGGGRAALPEGWIDGRSTCHYRMLPLLYAREADRVVEVLEEVAAPNRIKKVLKGWEPMKRMVYQGRGRKARALFDRDALPRKEQAIRNRLRREGFWMR
ncbi:hypothetical protein [Poseidonocella sedimentorum]|uniref:Glycosyl transferase family 8 n=1 Tax=Poseidonocella sedimentorum TaxID=871652 RepID=A0A1I6CWM2_9RHOB|nr:hypothetical protein [Poseidonocella sedimentorum]SFQ97550.1 hypothetical protein SAMN04515673_101492 [Poseidonocella sedimentorum]